MLKPEFIYVTYIETTPEKLWHALTDGNFTERYWFGARLRSDWKVGSSFEVGRSGAPFSDAGKVVEVDPPRRLAYTFVNLSDKYKNEFPALATFVLEPYGKLVKLTLTHEGFAEARKFCGRKAISPRESPGEAPPSCRASRACLRPGSRSKSPTMLSNSKIEL